MNVFWLWVHKIPGYLTAPALSGNFSLKIIFDYGSGNQKFILTKIFLILGAATKIYCDKNVFILGAATKNLF